MGQCRVGPCFCCITHVAKSCPRLYLFFFSLYTVGNKGDIFLVGVDLVRIGGVFYIGYTYMGSRAMEWPSVQSILWFSESSVYLQFLVCNVLCAMCSKQCLLCSVKSLV